MLSMKISVDISNQRLLRFAQRINRLRLTQEPIIREAHIVSETKEYFVSFDMTYFFELPIVFDEWSYYEASDEVEIKDYPKYLGMVGMIMCFFKLTPEEFVELFSFKEGISAQDLAHNIREFVRKKIIG